MYRAAVIHEKALVTDISLKYRKQLNWTLLLSESSISPRRGWFGTKAEYIILHSLRKILHVITFVFSHTKRKKMLLFGSSKKSFSHWKKINRTVEAFTSHALNFRRRGDPPPQMIIGIRSTPPVASRATFLLEKYCQTEVFIRQVFVMWGEHVKPVNVTWCSLSLLCLHQYMTE